VWGGTKGRSPGRVGDRFPGGAVGNRREVTRLKMGIGKELEKPGEILSKGHQSDDWRRKTARLIIGGVRIGFEPMNKGPVGVKTAIGC